MKEQHVYKSKAIRSSVSKFADMLAYKNIDLSTSKRTATQDRKKIEEMSTIIMKNKTINQATSKKELC